MRATEMANRDIDVFALLPLCYGLFCTGRMLGSQARLARLL